MSVEKTSPGQVSDLRFVKLAKALRQNLPRRKAAAKRKSNNVT